MPRLIILLLPVAALILLAVQNRTPAIALNFLGGSLPAVSFGLLLVIAAGVGALITLLLYGLIGLRRPPESKYKPMGRRVPYPDSGPGSSSSNPTPTYPATPVADLTSSYSTSAFVNDRSPAPSPAPSSAPPPAADPASIPQDSPSDAYQDGSRVSYQSPDAESYEEGYESQNEAQGSSNRATENSSGSSFVGSLKSNLFSAKKKYLDRERPGDEKPLGDDWGERRTVEQINDWEAVKPSVVEEGFDNLVQMGRSAGTNVGRMADDIASNWNNQTQENRPPNSQSDPYYPQPGAERPYDDDPYNDGSYSDDLDHGWENFDDGYENPALTDSATGSKRTYGDSLYGREPLPADDEYVDEIGPDGVYEADYKVIVPPSKPLDERAVEDTEDDRYYS